MQPRIRYKDREGILLKERVTQSKTPQTIKSARFPESARSADDSWKLRQRQAVEHTGQVLTWRWPPSVSSPVAENAALGI